MKKGSYFSFLVRVVIISFCCNNACYSQNATLDQAKQYFDKGLNSCNAKNYKNAIDEFLIRIAEYPERITYYALSSAYAKTGDWENTMPYNDLVGQENPPLSTVYYREVQKLMVWATKVRSLYSGHSGGLIGISSSPDVKMPTSEWFNLTPPNYNSSTLIEDFYFPKVQKGSGVETANVTGNNNIAIGSIQFFGFEGGRNLSDRTSSAISFNVGVSQLRDVTDLTSYTRVVFAAQDLFPGSVKEQKIGNILYRVIILRVKKIDDRSYLLNSIHVKIKGYL